MYEVTIEEIGLSGHFKWSVLIGNQSITVNASITSFYLPNGTYSINASSPDYKSENTSYPVLIAGSGVSLQIVFTPVEHKSLLSTLTSEVMYSPFSYIFGVIAALLYVRFYRGSARICSACLERIPRGRLHCQKCRKKKN